MARSDRPLSRKLIRLGFRAMGAARAHRQDIWPGLSIDRYRGLVHWRGSTLLELTTVVAIVPRNLPMIAVVGSGPSLRNQRIEALGDRTAILCNGAASLSDRIRPLAVAVEDERFVFRHQPMLAALDVSIPLLLSPAAIRAWAEVDAASLRGRTVALIDNLAKPVNASRRSLSEVQTDVASDGSTFLSRDPDAGVVITGTVAFSALQFALAARPERILLAGIDLSNDAQPRFYETDDSAPSGLSAGLTRILAGFALAYREAQKQGTELTCASPASALLPLGIPYDDTLASS